MSTQSVSNGSFAVTGKRRVVDLLELVLDEAAEEPTASPAPLSLLPLSPLPLEPTGDCGIAEAKRKRVKARRNLRSCMVR